MLSGVLPLVASLCLVPPVSGPVERPFVAPACRFCPGNRAVDYLADPGEPVIAPVSGTVRFAGKVGGVGYVTIEVVNSNPVTRESERRLVTVGGLESSPSLVRGGEVGQGRRLGEAVGPTVSLSLREISTTGEAIHVDPEPHLGRLRRRRARLVPLEFRPSIARAHRGVCALTR
ncbi:MAG: hypothetical protein RLZ86_181 [Actinomycetota bacterium]